MSKDTEVKLIDGTFPADDANDMLHKLFKHTINYHELKLFGDEVRFGKDTSKSKKRIDELKDDLSQVKAFMYKAILEGYDVEIESNVSIKLKKNEKANS